MRRAAKVRTNVACKGSMQSTITPVKDLFRSRQADAAVHDAHRELENKRAALMGIVSHHQHWPVS